MPNISIQQLTFQYPEQKVFDNFSFSCNSNLILFEGPSGCGKSTLLKILSGFLAPTRVRAFNTPPHCRLLLQEDALFPWLTVQQNLDLVGLNDVLPSTDPAIHLWRWIEPILDRRASHLSFGQRRTVELYRVLSHPSEFICLDEPFNFLDPERRLAIAKCISALLGRDISFAISSHHRDEIELLKGPVFRFGGQLPINELKLG